MLTPKKKTERRFERMLAKSKEFRPHVYLSKYVAPVFQKMVRAEAGARSGYEWFHRQGTMQSNFVPVGMCVCVTCGKMAAWTGDKKAGIEGIDTGHFVSSRKASIVLEETNVAPQCVSCNKFNYGMPEAYEKWMLATHGQDVIDRLRFLKTTTRQFNHDELVGLRISYMDRLKEACKRIKNGASIDIRVINERLD